MPIITKVQKRDATTGLPKGEEYQLGGGTEPTDGEIIEALTDAELIAPLEADTDDATGLLTDETGKVILI